MTIRSGITWLAFIITAACGCGAPSNPPMDPPVPVAAASDDKDDRQPANSETATSVEGTTGEDSAFDQNANSHSAVATEPADAPAAVETRNDCHALLVGCTTYDHLGSETHLRGPINDVTMLRQLLVNHFGAAYGNLTTLIENNGNNARPVRANIAREFERLATVAAPGISIVILLSGHGTQQPNDDPDDLSDPEPDGLDEVFLPADTAPSDDPSVLAIGNSISDDELGEWISRIRSRGAFVWVIVDACHSGSAIRGVRAYRQLSPDRFFSRDVLEAATAHASTELRSPLHTGGEEPSDSGDFVALYAAQPQEPTIELPMPPGDPDAQWSGLLTFTLARILAESSPLQ